MIPDIRDSFIRNFQEQQYQAMIEDINRSYQESLVFRLSETPLFLSDRFAQHLVSAAKEVLRPFSIQNFLLALQTRFHPACQ